MEKNKSESDEELPEKAFLKDEISSKSDPPNPLVLELNVDEIKDGID